MQDVERPAKGRARERLPSQDEIDRICLALGYERGKVPANKSQRVAIAWLLAIETGMRAGELCALKKDGESYVDLERRVAVLDTTKNGDGRKIPLSRAAVDLFKLLGDNVLDLSPSSVDALFRKAKGRAEIKGLHFHD